MSEKIKNKKDILQDIKNNYQNIEESLVRQLNMKNSIHPTTTGTAREDTWKQLFEMIIPKKFVIEQSVFIIDSSFEDEKSQTGISKEVDLAIIDETYTPYIFQYGRIKFIPIEAVAVVVECKSGSANTEDWCQRIDNLRTSDESIARMANGMAMGGTDMQKSTRPIKILCTMDKKGEDLKNESKGENENTVNYDITIVAKEKLLKLDVSFNEKFQELGNIYKELNHASLDNLSEKANVAINELESKSVTNLEVNNHSLLSFNFQLNQILMLINNPLLFPHLAYVQMFNKVVKKDGNSK